MTRLKRSKCTTVLAIAGAMKGRQDRERSERYFSSSRLQPRPLMWTDGERRLRNRTTTCHWGGTPAEPTARLLSRTGDHEHALHRTAAVRRHGSAGAGRDCSGNSLPWDQTRPGSTCEFGYPFEAQGHWSGGSVAMRAVGDNAGDLVPAPCYTQVRKYRRFRESGRRMTRRHEATETRFTSCKTDRRIQRRELQLGVIEVC